MTAQQRERFDPNSVLEPLNRGDYLRAFDRAMDLLDRRPRDRGLQYLAVLSLARAGATHQALHQLDSFRLTELEADLPDDSADADRAGLARDVAALHARLVKDRAEQDSGAERHRLAAEAARLYESAVGRGGGAYCCVNAATMWLLAGRLDRARSWAETTMQHLAREEASSSGADRYWHAATRAEAALLLDRTGDARDALSTAAGESAGAWGNRSVTRRQLAIICSAQGCDPAVLDALPVPAVIHFCGHIPDPTPHGRGLTDEQERATAEAVARYLDDRAVGFAYGSLASGADILVAEAVLARGAELIVVLPFQLQEFVATSVAPAGSDWVPRFHDCLSRANTVLYGTSGAHLGDNSLFDYCAQIAMGQAVIRAASLGTTAEQLAIWDGLADEGVGTGANVAVWRAGGRHTNVIAWRGSPGRPSVGPDLHGSDRSVRAILFCDVKGFGRLRDQQMQPFVEEVMAPLGRVLDAFGAVVLDRNTWGDGLHVVLSDVSAAADCALALQEVLRTCDFAGAGLPESLGLRIGAHVGPVYELDDPIRQRSSYYGTHVTRAARIEPRTPEGEVYATASFAALAALDESRRFACEYVGHVPLAKGFGRDPMYVVKRRPAAEQP